MKGSLLLWWGVPTDGWNSINTGIIKDCIGNLIVAYAGQGRGFSCNRDRALSFHPRNQTGQMIQYQWHCDRRGLLSTYAYALNQEGILSWGLMHRWSTLKSLLQKRVQSCIWVGLTPLQKRVQSCSTLIGTLFLSHTSYIHSRIYLWMSLQLAGRT